MISDLYVLICVWRYIIRNYIIISTSFCLVECDPIPENGDVKSSLGLITSCFQICVREACYN